MERTSRSSQMKRWIETRELKGCGDLSSKYELRNFRSNTKDNKHRTKAMRIFHKKSAKTAVRTYTYDMLCDAMRGNKELGEKATDYCLMKSRKRSTKWKNRSLYKTEEDEKTKVLLVMEELCIHDGGKRWVKVCLYDREKDVYYLRSLSNIKSHKGYKSLKDSKDSEWFIDNATMCADASFWMVLSTMIVGNVRVEK